MHKVCLYKSEKTKKKLHARNSDRKKKFQAKVTYINYIPVHNILHFPIELI